MATRAKRVKVWSGSGLVKKRPIVIPDQFGGAFEPRLLASRPGSGCTAWAVRSGVLHERPAAPAGHGPPSAREGSPLPEEYHAVSQGILQGLLPYRAPLVRRPTDPASHVPATSTNPTSQPPSNPALGRRVSRYPWNPRQPHRPVTHTATHTPHEPPPAASSSMRDPTCFNARPPSDPRRYWRCPKSAGKRAAQWVTPSVRRGVVVRRDTRPPAPSQPTPGPAELRRQRNDDLASDAARALGPAPANEGTLPAEVARHSPAAGSAATPSFVFLSAAAPPYIRRASSAASGARWLAAAGGAPDDDDEDADAAVPLLLPATREIVHERTQTHAVRALPAEVARYSPAAGSAATPPFVFLSAAAPPRASSASSAASGTRWPAAAGGAPDDDDEDADAAVPLLLPLPPAAARQRARRARPRGSRARSGTGLFANDKGGSTPSPSPRPGKKRGTMLADPFAAAPPRRGTAATATAAAGGKEVAGSELCSLSSPVVAGRCRAAPGAPAGPGSSTPSPRHQKRGKRATAVFCRRSPRHLRLSEPDAIPSPRSRVHLGAEGGAREATGQQRSPSSVEGPSTPPRRRRKATRAFPAAGARGAAPSPRNRLLGRSAAEGGTREATPSSAEWPSPPPRRKSPCAGGAAPPPLEPFPAEGGAREATGQRSPSSAGCPLTPPRRKKTPDREESPTEHSQAAGGERGAGGRLLLAAAGAGPRRRRTAAGAPAAELLPAADGTDRLRRHEPEERGTACLAPSAGVGHPAAPPLRRGNPAPPGDRGAWGAASHASPSSASGASPSAARGGGGGGNSGAGVAVGRGPPSVGSGGVLQLRDEGRGAACSRGESPGNRACNGAGIPGREAAVGYPRSRHAIGLDPRPRRWNSGSSSSSGGGGGRTGSRRRREARPRTVVVFTSRCGLQVVASRGGAGAAAGGVPRETGPPPGFVEVRGRPGVHVRRLDAAHCVPPPPAAHRKMFVLSGVRLASDAKRRVRVAAPKTPAFRTPLAGGLERKSTVNDLVRNGSPEPSEVDSADDPMDFIAEAAGSLDPETYRQVMETARAVFNPAPAASERAPTSPCRAPLPASHVALPAENSAQEGELLKEIVAGEGAALPADIVDPVTLRIINTPVSINNTSAVYDTDTFTEAEDLVAQGVKPNEAGRLPEHWVSAHAAEELLGTVKASWIALGCCPTTVNERVAQRLEEWKFEYRLKAYERLRAKGHRKEEMLRLVADMVELVVSLVDTVSGDRRRQKIASGIREEQRGHALAVHVAAVTKSYGAVVRAARLAAEQEAERASLHQRLGVVQNRPASERAPRVVENLTQRCRQLAGTAAYWKEHRGSALAEFQRVQTRLAELWAAAQTGPPAGEQPTPLHAYPVVCLPMPASADVLTALRLHVDPE
ncbi:hypothetical protein DIPPA_25207 [Diplonema papillatum]|nr:hypothetical protein DIPPA_25207 [Diplonema papillatum]